MKNIKWKILQTKKIYNSQWIDLYLQRIQLPNGKKINNFHRIKLQSSVVILPVTKSGDIVTIKSYKHGIRNITRSLPAGYINKGEKPLDAAKRELLEETGYGKAKKWISFGSYVSNSNYHCGKINFFVSINVSKIKKQNSGDLEDIEIEKLKLKFIKKQLESNKIKSLSSSFLIAKWLIYQKKTIRDCK